MKNYSLFPKNGVHNREVYAIKFVQYRRVPLCFIHLESIPKSLDPDYLNNRCPNVVVLALQSKIQNLTTLFNVIGKFIISPYDNQTF